MCFKRLNGTFVATGLYGGRLLLSLPEPAPLPGDTECQNMTVKDRPTGEFQPPSPPPRKCEFTVMIGTQNLRLLFVTTLVSSVLSFLLKST